MFWTTMLSFDMILETPQYIKVTISAHPMSVE